MNKIADGAGLGWGEIRSSVLDMVSLRNSRVK
jgi:hypothetical protein